MVLQLGWCISVLGLKEACLRSPGQIWVLVCAGIKVRDLSASAQLWLRVGDSSRNWLTAQRGGVALLTAEYGFHRGDSEAASGMRKIHSFDSMWRKGSASRASCCSMPSNVARCWRQPGTPLPGRSVLERREEAGTKTSQAASRHPHSRASRARMHKVAANGSRLRGASSGRA
jgi:hypothetical protein